VSFSFPIFFFLLVSPFPIRISQFLYFRLLIFMYTTLCKKENTSPLRFAPRPHSETSRFRSPSTLAPRRNLRTFPSHPCSCLEPDRSIRAPSRTCCYRRCFVFFRAWPAQRERITVIASAMSWYSGSSPYLKNVGNLNCPLRCTSTIRHTSSRLCHTLRSLYSLVDVQHSPANQEGARRNCWWRIPLLARRG
jgi:hypothetical protein